MKKLLALSGALAVMALAVAMPAGAESDQAKIKAENNTGMAVNITPAGHARLQGKVTATSSSTLSIQSWGGVWTVNVDSSDQILAKGKGKISLSDVKVGDQVMIQGKVSSSGGLVLDASKILDLSMSIRKGTLHGVISNLNTSARSFTLTLKNGATVNVNLASDAMLRLGKDTSASVSSLVNGMTVNVSGLLNKADNTLSGTKLMGSTEVETDAKANSGLHLGL